MIAGAGTLLQSGGVSGVILRPRQRVVYRISGCSARQSEPFLIRWPNAEYRIVDPDMDWQTQGNEPIRQNAVQHIKI